MRGFYKIMSKIESGIYILSLDNSSDFRVTWLDLRFPSYQFLEA